MDDAYEEAVTEVEFSSLFYYILEFRHIFPNLTPLVQILENL